jgi:hypothetical protein
MIYKPFLTFFSFACPKEKKQKKKAERKQPILPVLTASYAHSRMGRAFRSQPTAPFVRKSIGEFFPRSNSSTF